MSLRNNIPLLLISSRLLAGFAILTLALTSPGCTGTIPAALLVYGFLSDVFDGVIARQLGISTQKLRRLDSSVDQIFFLCVAAAAYIRCTDFFKAHAAAIIVLLAFEALTYVVSFIKFRKEIATHSIGAKIWAALLCCALTQIMLSCSSGILFQLSIWVGMVTRLEIILIILCLRKWTNDVPTLYHAIRLRHNKAIKRHKLLNG
ncbi:CDP-alcohol phosphatidyltransferase family protein [Rurimicrobium arvi]|uniref:CDP-diacylglycerol--glycerol-3-phosphate 3-phosphatidyltransferase n=1 Tax=Rurimicrobium arvi TaxID=2049916 RepID=A0ABP8MUM4_9BACT